MTTSTRIMSANLKGGRSPHGNGAGGPHSGLANAGVRMTMAIRRCNAQGVTLLGGQEVSGVQVERVVERHPHWTPLVAEPNDRWPNGATLGNVLFFDRRVWRLEELQDLDCWTSTAGELHFVDAYLRHIETRRQIRAIAGHFVAGRRAAAHRDRMALEADVRVAIKGERDPVALLFDFNTPAAFRGWAGARHKVDAALVRGLPTSAPRVHHGFVREISDVHAAVSIAVDLKRDV